MQNNWPTQPLILTPLIPLAWLMSWQSFVSCECLTGLRVVVTAALQEAVLMIAAVLFLVNVYNQVLIFQQTRLMKDSREYVQLAVVNALVLMAATVLAWGKPQPVLLPLHPTLPWGGFLLLASTQALLGNYFVGVTRPTSAAQRLPLWLGSAWLITGSCMLPWGLLLKLSQLTWRTLILLCMLALLVDQVRHLTDLFIVTPAQRSGGYLLMVGVDLAMTGMVLVTLPGALLTRQLDPVSVALVIAVLLVGVTDCVLAGMQRYHNDYRYGHAGSHLQAWILAGALVSVLFLLVGLWFLTEV